MLVIEGMERLEINILEIQGAHIVPDPIEIGRSSGIEDAGTVSHEQPEVARGANTLEEQAHIRWKEETINLLAEIGITDYCFDTEHSWKINSIDPDKVKSIDRPLGLNEQQIIYCIKESTGVSVPVLDSSSQEFLHRSIFSPEDLSQILSERRQSC